MKKELLKELLLELLDPSEYPFEIGKAYFIRTVTYHLIGKIKEIKGDFIIFEKDTIAYIADTDRFANTINDGSLKDQAEVEPIKVDGGLNINSITDYFVWEHAIPRNQK